MKKKGVSKHCSGGLFITKPGHPRANKDNHVFEHIVIAEGVLGKPLPQKAVIHHFDGNPANNTSSNIVICENQAYHLFLHQRTRAFKACGNASWIRCGYCQGYSAPEDMYISTGYGRHKECIKKYSVDYYRKQRGD